MHCSSFLYPQPREQLPPRRIAAVRRILYHVTAIANAADSTGPGPKSKQSPGLYRAGMEECLLGSVFYTPTEKAECSLRAANLVAGRPKQATR